MVHMSWNEACELDPSLLSLNGTIPPPDKVETVSGLTNLGWKLSFSELAPLVWRPVSDISQTFSISRIQEYQILKFLEKQPDLLTPKAILVNSRGLLIEWLEGETVKSVSNDTILRLVSKVHQMDMSNTAILPFSYTARIDHYWLQLMDSGHISEPVTGLYHQWRTVPVVGMVPPTLCHFDLGCHNLIKNDSGYQLIDWEYASLADPRIELAMLADQSETEVVPFVAQYCKMRNIQDIDGWIEGVKAWIPRVRVMSMLWYFLAHYHRKTDDYLINANLLLERLCR